MPRSFYIDFRGNSFVSDGERDWLDEARLGSHSATFCVRHETGVFTLHVENPPERPRMVQATETLDSVLYIGSC